jgi:hypothetical protein
MAKKDNILTTVPIVEIPKANGNGNHEETIDINKLSDNDKAIIKLVNHMVNTPDEKMHETSALPRRMISALAISKTFAETKIDDENDNFVLRWMLNYERFSRSIGGFHMKNLIMLAENQLTEEEEKGIEDDTP